MTDPIKTVLDTLAEIRRTLYAPEAEADGWGIIQRQLDDPDLQQAELFLTATTGGAQVEVTQMPADLDAAQVPDGLRQRAAEFISRNISAARLDEEAGQELEGESADEAAACFAVASLRRAAAELAGALAAECERVGRNRVMWKGQVESQAKVISELRAEVARLGAANEKIRSATLSGDPKPDYVAAERLAENYRATLAGLVLRGGAE